MLTRSSYEKINYKYFSILIENIFGFTKLQKNLKDEKGYYN